MFRNVVDFLQDDNFIIQVFEGKSLNDLVEIFTISSSELIQFVEAIKILKAPNDICCGLSEEDKSRMKVNCLLSLKDV